jgi:Protein of unknown function (DUF2934)
VATKARVLLEAPLGALGLGFQKDILRRRRPVASGFHRALKDVDPRKSIQVEKAKQRLQQRLAARRSKEAIRARARELWEQQGRPTGRDLEFWLQAERELSEDESE